MSDCRLVKEKSKFLLVVCVGYHCIILFVFKYFNFFIEQLNGFFCFNFPLQEIALHIGVSFFTFQMMSYVFDIYYRKTMPQKNPLLVLLYVTLFPQLIAGPIIRYD